MTTAPRARCSMCDAVYPQMDSFAVSKELERWESTLARANFLGNDEGSIDRAGIVALWINTTVHEIAAALTSLSDPESNIALSIRDYEKHPCPGVRAAYWGTTSVILLAEAPLVLGDDFVVREAVWLREGDRFHTCHAALRAMLAEEFGSEVGAS